MGKFLLLTGEKASGKTSALRRVVQDIGPAHFTGFVAAEQRRDGRRTGFEIETIDGRRGVLASVDSKSPLRVGGLNSEGVPKYGIDLTFLENVCVPLLDAADGERLVVLDEIGPMQLHSETFKRSVLSLLTRDVVVVGTIVLREMPWTDEFKTRPGVETFLLNHSNRDTFGEMLTLYVEKLFKDRSN